jgi:4-amino-4-deoxy-L-arabinose transferase-like glycosyltransferase
MQRPRRAGLERMSERWVYRDCAIILAVTLLVRGFVALPVRHPGTMDAAYYVDGALSLYQGRGFSDPFIWNYLDDPDDIPHPSHLYWMPLSSILAYLSFLLFGPGYRAAQVPFVLLSSLLPLVSYLVAYDVAHQRRHAVCAALFATFSGFYMMHWVSTDNFAPFALAGALCLWATGRGLGEDGSAGWFALAGVSAGLGHLSRADGALLAGVVMLAGAWQAWKERSGLGRLAIRYALFVVGYGLVMGPWFLRNGHVIGRPLATAGTQTLWLTAYDDLFSYAKPLNAQAYLSWGWGNILHSKLDGLWKNLGQLLFAGWMIFLAPFGLIGVWRLRRRVAFRAAWLYMVGLYLAMSLGFTFAGWRGGMLHSMVALLPSMYAASMEGLDACISWVARRRQSWRPGQARAVFSVAFVGFAVALSGMLVVQGQDGLDQDHPYAEVASWMDEHVPADARVMVNDPATFYYYGRRPCLAIPNADLDTVLEVMHRYDAAYVVLDGNNPTLRALFDAPQNDARLILLASFGGEAATYLFSVSG